VVVAVIVYAPLEAIRPPFFRAAKARLGLIEA
jgi:hypothetical protein